MYYHPPFPSTTSHGASWSSFLHPRSAETPPSHLSTSESCLTLQKGHGPVIPTLRGFQIRYTLRRRKNLSGLPSAQYSMVRRHIRQPIHTHDLCSTAVPGIVVVLFFQCLVTLFNPANRTRAGIKWGLVAYTTAMFTFVTIYTAMILDFLSIFYIDNRNFHGLDGAPAGPLGYQSHLYSKAIGIIPDVMFYLNIWLADGLLVSSVNSSRPGV